MGTEYTGPLLSYLPVVLSAFDSFPLRPLEREDFLSLPPAAVVGSLLFYLSAGGTLRQLDEALLETREVLFRAPEGRIVPGPLPESERFFFLLRALSPHRMEERGDRPEELRLVPLGEEGLEFDLDLFLDLPGFSSTNWRTFDALLVCLLARDSDMVSRRYFPPPPLHLPFLPGETVRAVFLEEESGFVVDGVGTAREEGLEVEGAPVPSGLVVEAVGRPLYTRAA